MFQTAAAARSVPSAGRDSGRQHEMMQMALNRVLLETLVAMGANKAALLAELKEAVFNLHISEQEDAGASMELLVRHVKTA